MNFEGDPDRARPDYHRPDLATFSSRCAKFAYEAAGKTSADEASRHRVFACRCSYSRRFLRKRGRWCRLSSCFWPSNQIDKAVNYGQIWLQSVRQPPPTRQVAFPSVFQRRKKKISEDHSQADTKTRAIANEAKAAICRSASVCFQISNFEFQNHPLRDQIQKAASGLSRTSVRLSGF